jgi:TPR repeat protein
MNTCLCGNLVNGNGTMCSRCTALHELGLKAGATDVEIKAAHRLYVKAWHPDRFPGDEKSIDAAQEKLKTINSAYEFLTSRSAKKGQSDRPRSSAQTGQPQEQTTAKERPPNGKSANQPSPQPPYPTPAPPTTSVFRRWGYLLYMLPVLLLVFLGVLWRISTSSNQSGSQSDIVPKSISSIQPVQDVSKPQRAESLTPPNPKTVDNQASTPVQKYKIVDIPDVGSVRFPAEMSENQISEAIRRNYPKIFDQQQTQVQQSSKDSLEKQTRPVAPVSTVDTNPPTPKPTIAEIGQQAETLYDQKRYADAAPLYDQACTGGSIVACGDLGFMYLTQQGVALDYSRAATLLGKSCDAGDSQSCNNLGSMYQNGQGVAQDYSQAVKLYGKACEGGSAEGCNSLGVMYQTGKGVVKNYSRGAALYSKACDQGSSYGCTDLGESYLAGRGVHKNKALAKSLFEKACSMGDDQDACDRLR